MSGPIILDLCGGTGAWSRPYAEAGYDVWVVTLPTYDVRCFDPPAGVRGVLAAPPCTEFSSSGARWWAAKPAWKLEHAIEVVRSCLGIVERARPRWWALENPVGRIAKCVTLGRPALVFDPCDFGDPYTKRTQLWGEFRPPRRSPVAPSANARPGSSPIHRCPPGPERARFRSITPPGFARAFFAANP